MFKKCAKGAETPRFRRGTEAPKPTPWWAVRPCLADDKPATFHRFIEEDRALFSINCFHPESVYDKMTRRFKTEGVIPPGCSTEILRTTFALVEYADGSVGKVKPELIQFLDKEGKA